jgi:predicted RNA-binding Zn-ribbon protein involved in translation (DUF1610 family)
MAWALDARQTGPLPAETRLVLVALADGTDATGRHGSFSKPTLAARLGVTTRTVQRAFALLEDLGLIRPGDQARVEYIRADRRPKVWDLALDGVQVVIKVTGQVVELGSEPYDETPQRGDSNVTPLPVDNQPRGDSGGSHGETLLSPDLSTNPKLPNSSKSESDPAARALGITDRECPTCGAPVYRTHRCRSSALDPASPNHGATIPELVMLNPPPRQDPTLDIAIGQCQWCGRKAPTNTLGVCLRCTMAVAKVGPDPHPLEEERP